MSEPEQRLSRQEIARRGDEIYEQKIRAVMEPECIGQVVAIDVLSGDYEVAKNVVTAADNLKARQPAAEIWLRRVGDRVLHCYGYLGFFMTVPRPEERPA